MSLDNVDVRKEIAQECDRIKSLLLSKNERYGNSALDPVRIFSKSSTIEQLNVRLDDKMSRILRGNDNLDDEDVDDDLMGYLVLRKIAKRLQDGSTSVQADGVPEVQQPTVAN